MVPICGRSFWENNVGARLFCQMLGKSNGVVERANEILTEDAYVVGMCAGKDTHLTKCTGRCNFKNKYKVGGKCSLWGKNCNKGSDAGPKVTCSGKIQILEGCMHYYFFKLKKCRENVFSFVIHFCLKYMCYCLY